MKKLFFLAGVIAAFSCEQPKPINAKGQTAYKGRFKGLFAQYFNIAIDTLEVHSPNGDSGVYYGRSIDSLNAQLFPEDMARQHSSAEPALFAIYKFAIDSARLGLITRTPSEYEPSSIKLFIYDKRNDSLTSYIEIGENWGDAGDYTVKKSWLFRDTSSKQLHILIDEFQGHDNSVDNPKDTTQDVRDLYTLLHFSKNGFDTVFMDEEKLPAKYNRLVKKKNQ